MDLRTLLKMTTSTIKRFFLFILFIVFAAFSSSGEISSKDSLKQGVNADEIARLRAIEALKKLEKFYQGKENGLKTSMGQHAFDSMLSLSRKQDSLKKDSLKQKAKFEKNQKIHNIENTLNAYGNRGFTIYDGIIYFTLFIILLFVYLYFRKMYKNKKFVFKEFYILWKQKFKELRDKERESEREKPNKKNK
jgi:hypothetical protein